MFGNNSNKIQQKAKAKFITSNQKYLRKYIINYAFNNTILTIYVCFLCNDMVWLTLITKILLMSIYKWVIKMFYFFGQNISKCARQWLVNLGMFNILQAGILYLHCCLRLCSTQRVRDQYTRISLQRILCFQNSSFSKLLSCSMHEWDFTQSAEKFPEIFSILDIQNGIYISSTEVSPICTVIFSTKSSAICFPDTSGQFASPTILALLLHAAFSSYPLSQINII